MSRDALPVGTRVRISPIVGDPFGGRLATVAKPERPVRDYVRVVKVDVFGATLFEFTVAELDEELEK